ncbi:Txe/YoeB family addiction module toxin [Corticibacterium sp. UT-5YL-CI-8]|nr:Txe/YoeB family addiction module toxin [Tianweitania sp. UT-5YL-CI-8]
MKLLWSTHAWQDYLHWQATDPKILQRVNELIRNISRSPFAGVGKPEPLRGQLSGWWSRRINHEHRLVYRLSGTGDSQVIEISACRFHYAS